MRRSVRESDIEDLLVRQCAKAGHLCLKLFMPQVVGMPDRLCLFRGGRIVFVELKAPGRKPTARQVRRHNLLRGMGFEIRVLDTPAGVEQFITQADRLRNNMRPEWDGNGEAGVAYESRPPGGGAGHGDVVLLTPNTNFSGSTPLYGGESAGKMGSAAGATTKGD